MPVSPPRPKGPHLNALRAFEAAARLGSFAAAAEELSVTPGAVTQHIKTLEAWAEAPLFVRNARGVALTPMAEALVPEFTRAFDQLGLAVHALRKQVAPNKIKLATLPSLAQYWLPARLGRLRRIAPDLQVSVIALEEAPNLVREPIDMSLFFTADPLGPNDIEVSQDRIFPICTPELAARQTRLEDLRNETLLRDSTWSDDWERWLSAQTDQGGIATGGTEHSLFAVALEEARHGGGVLMAHEALVQRFLDSGELVRPFAGIVNLPRKLVLRLSPKMIRSDQLALINDVLVGASK
ncbi:Glycine cleavage system transcriptional activator [Aliiroseovarius pelagivivens]|uniref:Glycine cleavage system transcriptional activator n=1 Tax=Aliiroseovarius pelagivivens TaxID=1639690 RepID=A0A2R8ASD1_9RHOB|nr:LysR family transcriptional regulator [Aliiroseovarius pelagivivens]SPF78971.1 Glycine cleavage system transcriptional activator [Aliiroseovarius pelagivivens]